MDNGLKKRLLSIAYVATVFFAFHYFLVYFLFSDFLSQYFSQIALSMIFAGSALISIILSNFFGDILKKFTNYKSLMFVIGLQFFSTLALIFAHNFNLFFIILLSVLHIILVTIIWVSINIFIEEFSDHENIGSIRGTVLTLYNFGAITAPFVAAQFFNLIGYTGIFLLSSLTLLPLFYLTHRFFNHVIEPKYKHINLFKDLKIIKKDINIRGVISSSFALNSFYAVINIYLVLYLTHNLGIPVLLYLGIITPISVIPFILIPYELGKYSDQIFGEKKAMLFGIFLTSLMLVSIYLFNITTNNIFVWILILFLARLGATITETENYAYFYKKIDGSSAGLIALFQNMSNIGFLFVSIIGALLINFFSIDLNVMFLIVGLIGFLAIFSILKIQDTEAKNKLKEEMKSKNKEINEKIEKEEIKKEKTAEKAWMKFNENNF
ncbi:MAG: MFS transporter [Candidatus Nomurabacteria bacterium]